MSVGVQHVRAFGLGALTGAALGVPYTIWIDPAGLGGTVTCAVLGTALIVASFAIKGEQ